MQIGVRRKSIDFNIKLAQNFYEVQFWTITIVETTLFVFSYEVKSEESTLEILNVLFLTLAIKKHR